MLLILALLPVSGLNLFIVSDPMGAGIILDGAPLSRQTPVLIRDIEPGKHKLELLKEGMVTERRTFTLEEDEATVILEYSLSGPFFRTAVKGESKITINGIPTEALDRVFTLPTGQYEIGREEGLSIEETFPGNGLLKGITLAFITSALYAGGIFLDAVLENPDGFTPSPLMLTSWGVTGLLGLGDLKLLLDRRKFKRAREEATVSEDQLSPESLYQEAEGYMTRGNLEMAFSRYSQLVQSHSESVYMPLALYKLSKINIVNGNTPLAAAGLEELLYAYPLPGLYDKVCHTLAGLSARENRLEKSGEYLDAMLFIDPLFTREEIDEYRSELFSRDTASPSDETDQTLSGIGTAADAAEGDDL